MKICLTANKGSITGYTIIKDGGNVSVNLDKKAIPITLVSDEMITYINKLNSKLSSINDYTPNLKKILESEFADKLVEFKDKASKKDLKEDISRSFVLNQNSYSEINTAVELKKQLSLLQQLKYVLTDYNIDFDSLPSTTQSEIERELTKNPDQLNNNDFIQAIKCLF